MTLRDSFPKFKKTFTMGLFDVFTTKSTEAAKYAPYSEVEALFNLLYICATADGEIGNAERGHLVNALQYKQVFRYANDFEALFTDANSAIDRYGKAGVIGGSVEKLPENFRQTAFTLCADIVLADGVVTEEETKSISAIGDCLGIDKAFAEQVVNVLLIKNRGNILN